jgi:vacuolar-type H+-ATPase subunit I/STV1
MKKKKVMENKNDITKLKELLTEASEICLQNINEAENIDLHSMMETLDDFIDELNAIENFENFEIYDEE